MDKRADPTLELKWLGTRTRVYADRIAHRPFYLLGETMIPIA